MPSAEVMDHLNHVTYPASKEDLEEACEKMSDIDEKDKRWFIENLPDRTYNSAEEVKQALSMPLQSAAP
ncbi:MAG: DUF2795 domain-containing protein [Candidatus Daviesbacteria bacterium]|nr:DUF2795 domain-containing protein [Candidatus Daviesbacteria bacterium]